MSEELFIGLISGTSRDGVDAALVRFDNDHPALLEALCLPYPEALALRLDDLLADGKRPHAAAMTGIDGSLARYFAAAATMLVERAGLQAASIRAIGSHGQTVWHDPDGTPPESIQLADPARIARLTGITTVGDFRRADIEAGGQGAPLAPLLHRALFRPEHGRRAVLNLGGIANISVIDERGGVSGFDTGPANCLLDAWVREATGRPFDDGGAWAAGGRVDAELLETLLGDPWFEREPPKSTGVEYFNLRWLRGRLGARSPTAEDLQATLAELTAASVANAVRVSGVADVLVCGGGAHNTDLLDRLRRRLPGTPLQPTSIAGLDPDWVEAVLFAWLARERLGGRLQETRAITGAVRPVALGRVCEPSPPKSLPG